MMRRRRWSVTARLTLSYGVLIVAFATTMALALRDMRAATREAELLRAGVVPLEVAIAQALAEQNVLAAQLNHATAAKNPSDVREWIETARKTRPLTMAAARKGAEQLRGEERESARLRDEVLPELAAIDERVRADSDAYARLFEALAAGDRPAADRAQSELVKIEADTAQRLRNLKTKTDATMERLGEKARARERLALELLIGLTALALVVAIGITLYARRVLRPLGTVTERARVVASGNLTPKPALDDGTEIGELSETFEAMVGAIRDARGELVKAERLAAIGKMAAHITHEIRNPLSAIGLNLEMLEGELGQGGDEDREKLELVTAIKAETNRLARLSEQYLSLARRPKPTLAPESLPDLIAELLAFLKPELDRSKVVAKLVGDRALGPIPLDEGLLRQAFLNLVRNAREAMTDGGELVITLSTHEPGVVRVDIDDTGPGIPDDVRSTIFDPFFTTKQRGTGLGLAVTREIVEAHKGRITCERGPGGRGTRFTVELPTS
jgi:two-component system, NtrC family, sensor kinase